MMPVVCRPSFLAMRQCAAMLFVSLRPSKILTESMPLRCRQRKSSSTTSSGYCVQPKSVRPRMSASRHSAGRCSRMSRRRSHGSSFMNLTATSKHAADITVTRSKFARRISGVASSIVCVLMRVAHNDCGPSRNVSSMNRSRVRPLLSPHLLERAPGRLGREKYCIDRADDAGSQRNDQHPLDAPRLCRQRQEEHAEHRADAAAGRADAGAGRANPRGPELAEIDVVHDAGCDEDHELEEAETDEHDRAGRLRREQIDQNTGRHPEESEDDERAPPERIDKCEAHEDSEQTDALNRKVAEGDSLRILCEAGHAQDVRQEDSRHIKGKAEHEIVTNAKIVVFAYAGEKSSAKCRTSLRCAAGFGAVAVSSASAPPSSLMIDSASSVRPVLRSQRGDSTNDRRVIRTTTAGIAPIASIQRHASGPAGSSR